MVRSPAARMLDIRRIYHEPDVPDLPRGRQVLDRFPDAERVEVAAHQDIPGLYGNPGTVTDWVRNKREVLVLGSKKSLAARPNGRSADFIAPSTANGCAMACNYCYVPRRKGYANPITVFVNTDRIIGYLQRHVARQGPKPAPNQCDPVDWVYDIGENGDCSVDALISDNVADLVSAFAELDGAKASFATKFVNPDLLTYDPRGGTRVRFSLMPHDVSRQLDLRTTPVSQRIAAVNDFVAAGYEVHLNLSPVVVFEGWLDGWRALLREVDDVLDSAAKAQLACEIIMLTHNEALHEVNLQWHPRGEDLLWRPDLQEHKQSHSGQRNLRYRASWKRTWLDRLIAVIDEEAPYLMVRYAF
ncbi:spore photoproduct lyase family protein [Nocardioides hwasunensis]|uniref:Spore photoproduct lyase family protein n=1 Tax=Nocardioides hwasunensis TaxID=397258 RepID=A0ABR8MHY1_9ACTN|nr:spore photoproduct lyase family protein [Nocardioides hwasunensis]MBD3915673.1 spore photoproduct lyase family protein [Nocardioides hwasunensis]